MSDILTLHATQRTELGRKAGVLRKNGKCPAVLYGLKKEPISLTIDTVSFVKLYEQAGSSILIDVAIEGGATEKALIGEIQTHPVTDRLRHVDLKRVDMQAKISTSVPLVLVGESLAVKGLNGTLNTQIDSLDVECLPDALVSEIEVDLSKLATFEDSIFVKDLQVPEGMTIFTDDEQLVATVTAPRSEKELEDLDSEVVEDVTQVAVQEKGKEESEDEGETK